jgi:hypothetical protein
MHDITGSIEWIKRYACSGGQVRLAANHFINVNPDVRILTGKMGEKASWNVKILNAWENYNLSL